MFILAGDVTERLIQMNETVGHQVIDWIKRFLRQCKKHNVVAFVLLGTPSHDWDQTAWFVTENQEIGCELYYADKVSVVRIESLKLDILAVPDEAYPTPELIWEEVTRVLINAQLTTVHFCIMHGFFDFQIPPTLNLKSHSSEKYLNITRYLIFIGHDHITKVHERIIVHGSLARLRHGEEGPKGFYMAMVDRETGEYRLQFVENHWAKLFIQIRLDDTLTNEQLIQQIKTTIQSLPNDSWIQLIASRDMLHQVGMSEWRKQHPEFNWSFSPTNDKRNGAGEEYAFKITNKSISVKRSNVVEQVLGRLQEKDIHPEVMNACKQYLEEYVENVRD